MDKKRLLELAGVQLNEKITSPEELILALMNELDVLTNHYDDLAETLRTRGWLDEGIDPSNVAEQIWAIYEKFEKEPMVRRIVVGAKRQREK